ARLMGSENNDAFRMDENGKVFTETNHAGGILGGITNGMPIVMRAAFKPTPSIAKKQATVNLSSGENTEIEIHGRHDPCVVVRAVPVVEAAAAIVILDLLLEGK
ncbi:MAG: chorismate synthase, partial [Clostridia bacterium]|nr:chorismate synthase [Clostridia bacterium]